MGLIGPWVISMGPQIQEPSPRTQGKPRTRGPWEPIARSMHLYIKTVVFMCIKKFEVIPRFYFNI
jgi:hypothetical protein